MTFRPPFRVYGPIPGGPGVSTGPTHVPVDPIPVHPPVGPIPVDPGVYGMPGGPHVPVDRGVFGPRRRHHLPGPFPGPMRGTGSGYQPQAITPQPPVAPSGAGGSHATGPRPSWYCPYCGRADGTHGPTG